MRRRIHDVALLVVEIISESVVVLHGVVSAHCRIKRAQVSMCVCSLCLYLYLCLFSC